MSLPEKTKTYRPWKSFWYAVDGVRIAFSREMNLWFQLSMGLVFSALAILQGRLILAMANLILMVVVMSLEMINSAFETLCDLVEPNHNPQVKIIKDMSAGSVLLVALLWAVVISYQLLVLFVLKDFDPLGLYLSNLRI